MADTCPTCGGALLGTVDKFCPACQKPIPTQAKGTQPNAVTTPYNPYRAAQGQQRQVVHPNQNPAVPQPNNIPIAYTPVPSANPTSAGSNTMSNTAPSKEIPNWIAVVIIIVVAGFFISRPARSTASSASGQTQQDSCFDLVSRIDRTPEALEVARKLDDEGEQSKCARAVSQHIAATPSNPSDVERFNWHYDLMAALNGIEFNHRVEAFRSKIGNGQ